MTAHAPAPGADDPTAPRTNAAAGGSARRSLATGGSARRSLAAGGSARRSLATARRGAARRGAARLGAARLTGLTIAAILGALLAGCGVRLETPLPTEPVPDAEEALRGATVADALTVRDLAETAATSATDPALRGAFEQVAGFADQHATALGGVYDSGLGELLSEADGSVETGPAPTDGPGGMGSPGDAGAPDDQATDPASPATPSDEVTAASDEVVAALVGASQRTQASADVTRDAELARLLASVAASEHSSARRLADLTGSTAADALTADEPALDAAPGGISAPDLATIVADEDATGYAYEVRAAQADGDLRASALAYAAIHRERADLWALAAGVDATEQDPRRIAYVLPDDLDTPALARQLENGLAESYASLVGTASTGSRAPLTTFLVNATLAAEAWGAPATAFPGMPEQAVAAG